MNKSNKEEIRKNAFAAMDAAAESEIQETGADLIVATEDLREAVKRMRGIVPKKGKLPILNCMLIQTDCSGNFCAKVTDLETTLKYTGRKVTGKLANAIPRLAIPFGSLASLLPHIRTEHTAFFMMRHGTITIRSGSLKAELKIMNVEDYPEEIGFENAIKFHAAGSLIDELANASHCTAIDDTRLMLYGACIEQQENGDFTIATTDGKRLFVRTVPKLLKNCNLPAYLIVSRKNIQRMKHFFSKLNISEFRCYLDGLHLTLIHQSEQTYCCSFKLIDGIFPNWRFVVPETLKNTLPISAFAWRWMLDSVSVSRGMQNIKIRIDNPFVHFSADDVYGNISASNSYRMLSDEPFEDSFDGFFNVQFLRDGLDMLKSDTIHFRFNNNQSPVVFESEHAKYILMPVRSR